MGKSSLLTAKCKCEINRLYDSLVSEKITNDSNKRIKNHRIIPELDPCKYYEKKEEIFPNSTLWKNRKYFRGERYVIGPR